MPRCSGGAATWNRNEGGAVGRGGAAAHSSQFRGRRGEKKKKKKQ